MKFKYGKETYAVPTNWSMVKFKDFAAFHDTGISLSKKLSYQTTIPEEILSNLRCADLIRILEVIQFTEGLPEFFEPVELKTEVGNEQYIKMEQSRRALQNGNQWTAAIEIVKIYTGKDISELPVTEAYGYAVFFLNSLADSSRSSNDLQITNPMKTS